jgi:hypothetical protein
MSFGYNNKRYLQLKWLKVAIVVVSTCGLHLQLKCHFQLLIVNFGDSQCK